MSRFRRSLMSGRKEFELSKYYVTASPSSGVGTVNVLLNDELLKSNEVTVTKTSNLNSAIYNSSTGQISYSYPSNTDTSGRKHYYIYVTYQGIKKIFDIDQNPDYIRNYSSEYSGFDSWKSSSLTSISGPTDGESVDSNTFTLKFTINLSVSYYRSTKTTYANYASGNSVAESTTTGTYGPYSTTGSTTITVSCSGSSGTTSGSGNANIYIEGAGYQTIPVSVSCSYTYKKGGYHDGAYEMDRVTWNASASSSVASGNPSTSGSGELAK